ncbi:MAG TPA: secondary thiamine-phosphate synthase enzyme YjbQ [bacterium]|nr:secondary thiamine-phosphate synthase enzyme YjbQ [bacterium]HPS31660.1 secondary thiamine-phosphate synthase enzyme YjbQ [bacterium]
MLFQFEVKTSVRTQMIDITAEIQKFVIESGIKEGLAVIHIPHTTAAVTINENADPDVQKDMTKFMDRLIPHENWFAHSEGNSDSHIKSSLFGCSQTVIIEKGRLILGTWQGIYFCEFDGPRTRKVFVKVI